MPEVSVIIPTYNSAHYLTQAIDSVLAQSFKDFEVLVIDDGSIDDTQRVLHGYGQPVRYIYQNNSGVAAARNRGIAESVGRYVAFLDADDTWYPHKLERQMAALKESSAEHLCYSAFTVVDADLTALGESHSQRRASALEDLLLRGNVVGSICTVICKRSLFSAVGGFDTTLSQCADWDMWVRLASQTEFIYLDEPLVTYRQHGTNMSRQVKLLESDSLKLLEKGFEMQHLPQALRILRNRAIARNYMVLAGSYFGVGMYFDFVRCATISVRTDFHQLGYLLAFPARIIARWQSRQNTRLA